MTHHQFGAITGDEQLGGLLQLGECVLMTENTVMAMRDLTGGNGDLPLLGVELVGRINGTQDTVQAVWLCSVLDAGALVGRVTAQLATLPEQARADFVLGMQAAMAGEEL